MKDFAFAKRYGHPLTLLRLDIDGFNNLFIRFGKDVSSKLLVDLSQNLKELIRTEDTVARTGVAKFALLLPSTTQEGGKILAQRILEGVRNSVVSETDDSITMTASIGLSSLYVTPDSSIEEILIATENNLQAAVNNGGNQIVMDEPMPDYDDALSMIEQGEDDKLAPFLSSMIQKLLPLLELYNKHMQAGLDDFIIRLKGGDAPEDED